MYEFQIYLIYFIYGKYYYNYCSSYHIFHQYELIKLLLSLSDMTTVMLGNFFVSGRTECTRLEIKYLVLNFVVVVSDQWDNK